MNFKKIFAGYKKNRLVFIFRYWLALRIFKYFSIDTESLLSKESKSIKIINKYNDSEFVVKPNGDKVTDNYFRKLFKSYKVKGQFLVSLNNSYLLTSWSIPVTKDGQILIETSGKLGLLILNIMEDKNKCILPEYKFIFYILLIKISDFFKISLFDKTKNDCLFHIVPRHISRPRPSPYEPQFGHWIIENLPQVKMFLESLKHSKNCKLFVGRVIMDWQKETLDLLGVDDKNILSFKQPYVLKVKTLYISRLPYVHSREYNFDPESRNWINKTMRSNAQKKYAIKEEMKYPILFSREYFDRRKIICNKSIYEFMTSKDIRVIHIEQITELEKIKASFNSNLIIGFPSGSAMTNMLYSSNPKIIDVLSAEKSSFITIWFLLSRELGFDYSLFLCKEKKDNKHHLYKDLIINENEFKKFIQYKLDTLYKF